jgi:two-component system osmolarity sensor histidine kinase EnvZ
MSVPPSSTAVASAGEIRRSWLERAWRRFKADRRFGRFVPRTLFGRAMLIFVVPLVALQAVSAWWFYEQHWDNVTSRLSRALAGDIRLVISLRSDFPGEENFRWIQQRAVEDMRLRVSFRPGDAIREEQRIPQFSILERELAIRIEQDIRRPYFIDTSTIDRRVRIEVQLPDGVLEVQTPIGRLFTTSSWGFVAFTTGTAVLLFGLATWLLSRSVRPIQKLAQIADNLGKGRDVPDFEPEGTREVRQAATAFLTMRERLRRQIQQRTEMLAGVSHDLRTPLTRMKLSLALLDDVPERRELEADVGEMERMIEGYLAFARGEGDEEPQPVDLVAILEEVVNYARRDSRDILLAVSGDLRTMLRPTAIRRCLTNLLANAARHGRHVEVVGQRRQTMIEILIDDDGPGIPADRREDVFRPFFRIDPSRNRDTGGVGLGMTIARDVARSHGGDISLDDAPTGGLRVRVRLPV